MSFQLAGVTWLFLLCSSALPIGAWSASSTLFDQQNSKTKPSVRVSTLTGCVDEQEGKGYVLVEDRTLRIMAVLQAEGFPQEGFAKYLGNKVTVHGRTGSDGDPKVMRVQRVAKVADGCAPAQ